MIQIDATNDKRHKIWNFFAKVSGFRFSFRQFLQTFLIMTINFSTNSLSIIIFHRDSKN